MTEPILCPQCGSEIPVGSPAGHCPKCLMLAGLESQSSSDPKLQPTRPSPPAGSTGFVPPAIEELAAGFPQLEVLELLGRGGMGAVYKARQKQLDRFVAVKILPREVGADPAFAERFTREARALARLSHPNIVAVHDFGRTADGLFYFVMEYVDGVNLRQAIQAGNMSSKEVLAIVPQICDALQFAHDEGIVHRDIKPENILVDKRGRVKIADFGLAKLLGQAPGDALLTATQQVMGTLRYMAPEQMDGTRAIDHRADIYSLGVVFYELLTGELPIGRFALPSKKVEIDVRLDEVVLRALETKPELRYQHASEVKTDVETIAGGSAPRADNETPVAESPSTAWWLRQTRTTQRAIQGLLILCFAIGMLGFLTVDQGTEKLSLEETRTYFRIGVWDPWYRSEWQNAKGGGFTFNIFTGSFLLGVAAVVSFVLSTKIALIERHRRRTVNERSSAPAISGGSEGNSQSLPFYSWEFALRAVVVLVCFIGLCLVLVPWVHVWAVGRNTAIDSNDFLHDGTFGLLSGIHVEVIFKGYDLWQCLLSGTIFFLLGSQLLTTLQWRRPAPWWYATISLGAIAIVVLSASILLYPPADLTGGSAHFPVLTDYDRKFYDGQMAQGKMREAATTEQLMEGLRKEGAFDLDTIRFAVTKGEITIDSRLSLAPWLTATLGVCLLVFVFGSIGLRRRDDEARRPSKSGAASLPDPPLTPKNATAKSSKDCGFAAVLAAAIAAGWTVALVLDAGGTEFSNPPAVAVIALNLLVPLAFATLVVWLVSLTFQPPGEAWLDRLARHWPILIACHLLVFFIVILQPRLPGLSWDQVAFSTPPWNITIQAPAEHYMRNEVIETKQLAYQLWGANTRAGSIAVGTAALGLFALLLTVASPRAKRWQAGIVAIAGVIICGAISTYIASPPPRETTFTRDQYRDADPRHPAESFFVLADREFEKGVSEIPYLSPAQYQGLKADHSRLIVRHTHGDVPAWFLLPGILLVLCGVVMWRRAASRAPLAA